MHPILSYSSGRVVNIGKTDNDKEGKVKHAGGDLTGRQEGARHGIEPHSWRNEKIEHFSKKKVYNTTVDWIDVRFLGHGRHASTLPLFMSQMKKGRKEKKVRVLLKKGHIILSLLWEEGCRGSNYRLVQPHDGKGMHVNVNTHQDCLSTLDACHCEERGQRHESRASYSETWTQHEQRTELKRQTSWDFGRWRPKWMHERCLTLHQRTSAWTGTRTWTRICVCAQSGACAHVCLYLSVSVWLCRPMCYCWPLRNILLFVLVVSHFPNIEQPIWWCFESMWMHPSIAFIIRVVNGESVFAKNGQVTPVVQSCTVSRCRFVSLSSPLSSPLRSPSHAWCEPIAHIGFVLFFLVLPYHCILWFAHYPTSVAKLD